MNWEIRQGDALTVLKTMPSESVHMVCTSPPYYQLRAYKAGPQEMGSEATPAEYLERMVAVFREVKRVLRGDGTCWVNMGTTMADGDNLGIPERLVLALQAPYYTGVIKKETDRAWLAALIDGEGSIGIRRIDRHGTLADGTDGEPSFVPILGIGNNDVCLLERCIEITGYGSVRLKDRPHVDARGIVSRHDYFGWRLDANKAMQIIREVYPFLVAKRKQAILAATLDASNKKGKREWNSGPVPQAEREKRLLLKELSHKANQREAFDMPSWAVEPATCFEPGWTWRSTVIWAKKSSIPESSSGWEWRRHRVIMHHADVSSVQDGQGVSPQGDSDLPRLQEAEAPGIHQGQPRPMGPPLFGEREGAKVNRQVPLVREGAPDTPESASQKVRRRPGEVPRVLAQEQQAPGEQGATTPILGVSERKGCQTGDGSRVQDFAKGASSGNQGCREASPERSRHGLQADGGGVGDDQGGPSQQMLLLPPKDGTPDDGSRYSALEGRQAHSRERRSGVPQLQQPQGSEALAPVLVDCSGCPKCSPNDGYVLHKGSWRATRSFEVIYMLTKGAGYFADQEAVKEPSTGQVGQAANFKRNTKESMVPGQTALQHRDAREPTTDNGSRNPRDIQWFAPKPLGRIEPYSEPVDVAHYAAFPPELPEWCIKASTSEKGVCATCGAPFARVVEKSRAWASGSGKAGGYKGGGKWDGLSQGSGATGDIRNGPTVESRTLSWRTTCEHKGEPVAATVLDCFGGTMTTGVVALRLGRRFLGIELSEKYCELGRARILADAPLLNGFGQGSTTTG